MPNKEEYVQTLRGRSVGTVSATLMLHSGIQKASHQLSLCGGDFILKVRGHSQVGMVCASVGVFQAQSWFT